jgi:predicted NBD/HSP70 family sugar kinase
MKQLLKQSQTNVKENNLLLILNTIIKKEPISRADLMRTTNISKPTVSHLITELLQRKIIYEIGIGESKGGRRPILLKFNSEKKYFLTIDIGREDYRIAISDLKGVIKKRINGVFKKSQKVYDRLDLIKVKIFALFEDLKIESDDILKSICSCPGTYVGNGREFQWSPRTDEIGYYDLHDFFLRELQVEIEIKHATKLALFGEKVAGIARNCSNAIYIDFGYGLGCSLLINGEIYFGPYNSSGEIGYFYTNIEEFKNYKIKRFEHGPLCNRISGRAIQGKGVMAVQNNKEGILPELVNGDINQITGETIFRGAKLNDRTSKNILKDAFEHFNMALCNMINIFTPELVILGGGFSHSGEFLLSCILDEIKDKVLYMPRIELSALKDEASIIGGIHYLIKNTDYLKVL